MDDNFMIRHVFQNEEDETFLMLESSIMQIEGANNGFVQQTLKNFEDNGDIFNFISRNASTGLKDKNKKMIYVGDIVRWEKVTYTDCSKETVEDTELIEGVIDWLETMFVLKTDATRRLMLLPHVVEDQSEFEVIGNIYEDPELIKN
ncbi:YopX family protein [Bacillus anthracis]|uniref:YopX family protein n=1 Tax=Bacillus anthracis TaxID=1392 RepID=UPI003D1FEC51